MTLRRTGAVPARLGPLSRAERALWRAAARGELADLRTGKADGDDASRGSGWAAERCVRAEVLAALMLGANPSEPGSVPAIRLAGAKVTGRLVATGATINRTLAFDQCYFEEQLELDEASGTSIRMTACHLPGFSAAGLQVSGSIVFKDCVIRGRLSLYTATIAGELILGGTKILNPGDWTLFAGGLTVQGGLFCRWNFESHGTVNLPGARLHGGVFFEFARLIEPGGKAFDAENASVDGPMLFFDLLVDGDVRLPGARIGSELSFARAKFIGRESRALDCSRVQATRLDLATASPIIGAVDLGNAHVGVLADDPATWPSDLRLDGLSYDSIVSASPSISASDRIDWLRRDPTGYRPQPYEELARWFRRVGHDDQARAVLFAKQLHRRTEMLAISKAWGYLLEWSVGYGYKPWRAMAWLVMLVALGTTVFAIAPPKASTPSSSAHFDSLVFTINLLLPIGHFGQADLWSLSDGQEWFAYSLVAAGWLMATAVVSALTRMLSTA
jgi:hypothetical protein